jgi:hypothetical protein
VPTWARDGQHDPPSSHASAFAGLAKTPVSSRSSQHASRALVESITQKGPERFTSLINDVSSRIFDVLPDDTWSYAGHGDDSTIGENFSADNRPCGLWNVDASSRKMSVRWTVEYRLTVPSDVH